ncbi:MAG: hypothetical protein V4641_12245 [Pseudomonadota bacterium]
MLSFLHRRKRRYSDHNRHFGPFTFSRHGSESWRPLGIVLDSGDDDESPGCHVRVQGFGYTLVCELPAILKPWRQWVDTSKYSWSKGSGGYWDVHSQEYGATVSDGFVQVFLGPQTHDSTTTKSWCTHLPWTQWRYYRHSLYDTDGALFWSGVENGKGDRNTRAAAREAASYAKEACPTVTFLIEDFDGERITATTLMEQREWKFGTGHFRWLSWFRKDMVRRSLDISFDKETGTEKGSWKGGTTGCGIDMLPGELHEQAFRRYCEQDHRSKSGKYAVRYVGRG